jgi:DNA modification methylase
MLIRGDARHLPLRDCCVQTVVTSPPYYGLRDYGTATWADGDSACDHRKGGASTWGLGSTGSSTLRGRPNNDSHEVAQLIAVFREIRRVLRDDGTVWLNIGDSYSSGGRTSQAIPTMGTMRKTPPIRVPVIDGIKPKDLLGIPWMLAFALRADGWYLRQDNIWHKPNSMPESVTDRTTRNHEYLFLLAKSERYFYDADAIKEPAVMKPQNRFTPRNGKEQGYPVHRRPDGATDPIDRNKRSVWTVNTEPFGGPHFACMPEALVEPCILAGCPPSGLVLDPFIGSGTVGAVAERLSRRWVGVDLTHQTLAEERTAQRGLRFEFDSPAPGALDIGPRPVRRGPQDQGDADQREQQGNLIP